MLNIGIIGLGSFGIKRAQAVQHSTKGNLYAVSDINNELSYKISEELKTKHMQVNELIESPEIHLIIISTPNKFHSELSIKSLEAGKHVLCEKPMAISLIEAKQMIETSFKTQKQLKIGSNHRFFNSIIEMEKIIKNNEIGEILDFRGSIGHNGEKIQNTWFWDPSISGGGTLIDNGWHLIDIAQEILGRFSTITGNTSNIYWKNCPVEDYSECTLKTSNGKTASITSSWRKMDGYFEIELFGTKGILKVDGRFDKNNNESISWQIQDSHNSIKSIQFERTYPDTYTKEINNFIAQIITGNSLTQHSLENSLNILKLIKDLYSQNNQY
ncbi:MAG: Oxidoreductase protein [uncultured bacterium]|nr:MAG: Oxidoreductase protein [uncultured bacterium]